MRHLSISGISQLLLNQFWPNFKCRYLKTSRTDFSCHGDICPGNISPGDICPYQQYLSSDPTLTKLLGPYFDEILQVVFLGTSRTDSDCHGDICPGNICPGDICPYQEYLNCYWPDYDETLNVGSWEHLEQILNTILTPNIEPNMNPIFNPIFNAIMKPKYWTRISNPILNPNIEPNI